MGPGRDDVPEPRTLIENLRLVVDEPGTPHSTTVAAGAFVKAGHFKKTERVIGPLPVGKVVNVDAVEVDEDKYDPDASVIAEVAAPSRLDE